MFFICVIFILSWYHIDDNEWLQGAMEPGTPSSTVKPKTDLPALTDKEALSKDTEGDSEDISVVKDKNVTTDDDISIIEEITPDEMNSEIDMVLRERKNVLQDSLETF
jgi:hypothetical protein